MDFHERIFLVNRISTGIIYLTINGDIYKQIQPNKDMIALADMVYKNILSENKFAELITRDQVKSLLIQKGIWNPKMDEDIKALNTMADDAKLFMYKSLYNQKDKENARKRLRNIEKQSEGLLIKKLSFDHTTLEYFAEQSREEFLTAISIRDSNDNPVYTFDNYKRKDNFILQRFIGFNQINFIKTPVYRELARSEPFRSIWAIGKEDCFKLPPFELSPDQKSLILYSKMYDNVYENPERPPEEVIDDDDLLDGWFVDQRRQAEKDRKQKQVDKVTNQRGDSGDLFLMARNKTEAKDVKELNSLDSLRRINQRQAKIKQAGTVEEQHLPDIQEDLRRQAMQEMVDKRKTRG